MNGVYNLILEVMASIDEKLASSYFHHVWKVEKTFQNVDEYAERVIEPQLKDENVESDNGDEEE